MMSDIKLEESDYCRFCAENKHCTNFIGDKKCQIIKLINYFNMSYVDVSQDGLSKVICDVCFNFINQAYEFFEKVKQTQINLNEIQNIKTETSNTEFKTEEYESDQDWPEFDEPLIYEMTVNKNSLLDSLDYEKNIINESIDKKDRKRTRPKQPTNMSMTKKNTTCKTKKIKAKDKDNINMCVDSWATYPWACKHCKIKFDKMEDLRLHSQVEHQKCYGFSCADCTVKLDSFNVFVSHVREHREILKHYCEYCNQKFEDPSLCAEHTKSHTTDGQAICNLCGEIFPEAKLLQSHNSQYKKVTIRKRIKAARHKVYLPHDNQSSWLNYGWTCLVCGETFRDVATLRQHGYEVHEECYVIKCMDCPSKSNSFIKFIRHVQAHRPYLKKYCAYCNKKINNEKQLETHVNKHFAGSQKPCYGCGHIFKNNDLRKAHMKKFMTPRPTHEIDPEDLVCNICDKHFLTLLKLKVHKEIHNDNRTRNYTCDTCGKAFFNLGTLKGHIALHSEKTHTCKICTKSFFAKSQLKIHVQTHLQMLQVECDYCGKRGTKSWLVRHIKYHSGYRPHKCDICGKTFTEANFLRSHSYIHTGHRPYSCSICGQGFTHWGNCNKHMISSHGIILGKKKVLSKETMSSLDKETTEWVDELIKNKK